MEIFSAEHDMTNLYFNVLLVIMWRNNGRPAETSWKRCKLRQGMVKVNTVWALKYRPSGENMEKHGTGRRDVSTAHTPAGRSAPEPPASGVCLCSWILRSHLHSLNSLDAHRYSRGSGDWVGKTTAPHCLPTAVAFNYTQGTNHRST